MKKRIYGLETEYGIIFTASGKRILSSERAVRYLFEKLVTTENFLNTFLENGSRVYLDTGCHPEYATPEVSNLRDLIIYDKAGEKILLDLLLSAESKLREDGLAGTLSIFKNNTDFAGNSYGCHENYLLDRSTDFFYLVDQFIPFLVTRQIFTGAGKIIPTRWGGEYIISQRTEYICHKISGTTTNDRSIINTRDEPHADKDKFRRLHIIVGDTNMSEFTNYLKVGITTMILEMVEERFLSIDFSLRHPVKALKDISHDLSCKKKIKLDDGRKFSPLEIQQEYLSWAKRYYASKERDPVVDDLLKKWSYVLEKLEDDPWQLNREIDWVIKMNLIESYREKYNLSWNDPRILMMDLQYHDIRPERGLFYHLENKGLVEKMLTEEEIIAAITTPPQDTRAKLRGDFIKFAKREKIRYDLDWSYIRLGSLLNFTIICKDPFKTDNEKFTEFQQRLEKYNLRRFSFF